MRKLFLIIFASVLYTGSALGQSADEESLRLKQEITLESVSGPSDPDPALQNNSLWQDRGQPHLSVGTAFTAAGGLGSGVSFYAMPSYSLSLTPRVSLHAGLIATSYSGFGVNPYQAETGQNLAFKSLAVYGAASYRMSDRLMLHGAGVKNLVNTPVPPGLYFPSDHLSLGATYKLGDNISVGATIRMDRGNSYFPVSPYPGSRYGSPFSSPYYW